MSLLRDGALLEAQGPEIWLRGPVVPQGHPSAREEQPDAAPQPRRISWVSAHGGAGATTLAALLGGVDVGNRWPDLSQGEPGTIMVVARTHAAGLQAVSRMLDLFRREEQPPGLQVLAVVLVADAPGRVPRQLAQRIKVIGSVVAVHRVPWVPGWRTGELKGTPPREIGALARLIGSPPTTS